MKKLIDYLYEVRSELSKIEWPKRNHVTKLTLTVIIITAMVGTYVGLLDIGFTKLLETLVNK